METSRRALAGALWTIGVASFFLVSISGCSSGEGGGPLDGGPGADGGDGGPPVTTVLHPKDPPLPGEVECKVTETTNIPVPPYMHVPLCTPVTYSTNPPSGGDHWPQWATFAVHDTPVPREMYVHDMEHGAVVLSYKCATACPDVVAAFEAVMANQGDILCAMTGTAIQARVLITPDPDLPAPIAASAWGATYVATCIDNDSLAKFMNAAIGKGPEQLCADGYDPPMCP